MTGLYLVIVFVFDSDSYPFSGGREKTGKGATVNNCFVFKGQKLLLSVE